MRGCGQHGMLHKTKCYHLGESELASDVITARLLRGKHNFVSTKNMLFFDFLGPILAAHLSVIILNQHILFEKFQL